MGLEDGGRFGANLVAIRPVAPLRRVAPLAATAEVVEAPEPEREHRVSVRVELVAAEPPVPQSVSTAPKPLPPQASLESDAAQLTAARTSAVLARARGVRAYAATQDLMDENALARGVCVRLDV